ncbi:hypothetical protein FA95DRAFT_908997 [Auriscalpium vulgare]|uniref:Uncharacterized protein n=1 Tax=Auriscalpium vulgare TaxID=40419 RepID=A0ACB8RYN6_9AGAM|nr:hypothetical protein FA95DRAFT_908997 [Auriscalpium vulgare]
MRSFWADTVGKPRLHVEMAQKRVHVGAGCSRGRNVPPPSSAFNRAAQRVPHTQTLLYAVEVLHNSSGHATRMTAMSRDGPGRTGDIIRQLPTAAHHLGAQRATRQQCRVGEWRRKMVSKSAPVFCIPAPAARTRAHLAAQSSPSFQPTSPPVRPLYLLLPSCCRRCWLGIWRMSPCWCASRGTSSH